MMTPPPKQFRSVLLMKKPEGLIDTSCVESSNLDSVIVKMSCENMKCSISNHLANKLLQLRVPSHTRLSFAAFKALLLVLVDMRVLVN